MLVSLRIGSFVVVTLDPMLELELWAVEPLKANLNMEGKNELHSSNLAETSFLLQISRKKIHL